MLSKSPREILCLRAISYGGVKGNGERLYARLHALGTRNVKIPRREKEKGRVFPAPSVLAAPSRCRAEITRIRLWPETDGEPAARCVQLKRILCRATREDAGSDSRATI